LEASVCPILWRNASSGQNYIYPMNGTAILAMQGYIRTVADQDWEVKGTADYDGDGMTESYVRAVATSIGTRRIGKSIRDRPRNVS